MPATPARRVRTSTARRPFEARPVPVPTTSWILSSSGVCAAWARIASATSAGLRAERALIVEVEPLEPAGLKDPWSLLQLETTRAKAASSMIEAITSKYVDLRILGMGSFLLRCEPGTREGRLRAPPDGFRGEKARGSVDFTTIPRLDQSRTGAPGARGRARPARPALHRSPADDSTKLQLGGIERRLRELHLHGLEGFDHDLRYGEVSIPLLVGGDDEPGGRFRAAADQGVFIRPLVIVPKLAFLEVGWSELPAFRRILDPLLDPLLLLVLADMQEEFEDRDVVLDQMPLERVDLVVARFPDRSRLEPVHAHDDHVLVVRPVEDPEIASGGHRLVDAPEKIVLELFLGGHLERPDAAPGRIESRHDVADRAVFPAGIHGLKHDEQGTLVLGVEEILELGEALDALLEDCVGVPPAPESRRGLGIVVRERDLAPGLYAQPLAQVHSTQYARAPAMGHTGIPWQDVPPEPSARKSGSMPARRSRISAGETRSWPSSSIESGPSVSSWIRWPRRSRPSPRASSTSRSRAGRPRPSRAVSGTAWGTAASPRPSASSRRPTRCSAKSESPGRRSRPCAISRRKRSTGRSHRCGGWAR